MDIASIHSKFSESTGVCTDTRKIKPDCIFFALKGPNFNGNTMAEQALNLGAKYAVIDEVIYKKDNRFLLCDDVLTTLQQVANFHRKQLHIPIIAITGSNGKTTTKELINAVLKVKYNTYATQGNLNNHIGVPLTLLSMDQHTEIGIVEMGANHQKEISSYCQIAEPTHGLITNIGKAHLEGFGGYEGVKKGKGELYEYLSQDQGIIFMNSADTVLKSMHHGKAITYPAPGDFLSCELVEEVPFVVFRSESSQIFTTHLTGKYNFDNIAAALCVGKFFSVDQQAAKEAVAAYDPQNNRSQMMRIGSNSILLDAYNANPSSMKAAVTNFAKLPAENKIVILGDMFELGEESASEHAQLGMLISTLQFNLIILCGKEMMKAKEVLPQAKYFEKRDLLEAWLRSNPISQGSILIKGSRGIGLENILEFI